MIRGGALAGGALAVEMAAARAPESTARPSSRTLISAHRPVARQAVGDGDHAGGVRAQPLLEQRVVLSAEVSSSRRHSRLPDVTAAEVADGRTFERGVRLLPHAGAWRPTLRWLRRGMNTAHTRQAPGD